LTNLLFDELDNSGFEGEEIWKIGIAANMK